MMHKIQGFTLVELMITIAIVIILTMIGLPSFNALVRDSNMTAVANDLLSALNYARSEAVTRNTNVVVESKSGIAKNWSSGWNIYVDLNGNSTLDAGELLKTQDALANSYTLWANANNLADKIVYQASGMRDVITGGTFFLCQKNDASSARAIIINSVGRVRVDSANQCS